jgi:hypothetical protein
MVTRRELAHLRAAREQDEKSRSVADDTQRHLGARGLYVRAVEIDRRSVQDCIDAQNWARNRRPTAMLPAWLAKLLEQGRAHFLTGWCRECGVTWLGRRAQGAPWIVWADRSETICRDCAAAQKDAP